jgi:hypothetical protein
MLGTVGVPLPGASFVAAATAETAVAAGADATDAVVLAGVVSVRESIIGST